MKAFAKKQFGIRTLALVALLSSVAVGTAMTSSTAQGWQRRSEQVIVHLGTTIGDMQNTNMAFMIATNLAAHGAKVTLFVDRDGVRVADTRVPLENLTWAGATLQSRYDAFLEAGGEVLVCPACAADAGMSADDLREGAVMGNPDLVAGIMLRADKILDY